MELEFEWDGTWSGCLGILLYSAIGFGVFIAVNILADLFFPNYNPPVDPPGKSIYEVDFMATSLHEGGLTRLRNVPLENGERYSLYLVQEVEHGCPGGLRRRCFYTMERYEDQGVKLFDSRENRIANEMTRYAIYDGTSESSYQMATFTAAAKGNEDLILIFGEAVIMTTYRDRDSDITETTTADLSDILAEPDEDLRSLRIVIRHEVPEPPGQMGE